MKKLAYANGVLEGLAGIGLLAFANMIPGSESYGDAGFLWVRMYGAGALAIGLFSILVAKNLDAQQIKQVFMPAMLVFHFIVAILSFYGYSIGVSPDPGIGVLHSTLTLIFAFFYFFR